MQPDTTPNIPPAQPLSPPQQPQKNTGLRVGLSVGAIIVGLILVIVLFGHPSPKPVTTTTVVKTGCVAHQLALGATGSCVNDLQSMINYMESGGYTQCPFTGGAALSVNGTYDNATQAQVVSVQNWYKCYNAQQGFGGSVSTSGTVDTNTWKALCTYAYTFPKNSGQAASPSLTATLAAGKDAGC